MPFALPSLRSPAAVVATPGGGSRFVLGGARNKPPSKWVLTYRQKQGDWAQERQVAADKEAARVAATKRQLSMLAARRCFGGLFDRQQKVSYDATQTIRAQARPAELWQPELWGSNNTCEVTLLPVRGGASRRCRYCPCVVGLAVLAEQGEIGDGAFVCPDCTSEISMTTDELVFEQRRQHERQIQMHAVTKMQKGWRARFARREFQAMKCGAARLQSHIRGIAARRGMRFHFAIVARAFRIRVVSATGLRSSCGGAAAEGKGKGGGEDQGKASRIRRNSSVEDTDDGDGGAGGGADADVYAVLQVVKGVETDKSIFRFETKVRRSTLAPSWNESFFIPGMDGRAAIVLTVLDGSGTKHSFMGQAVQQLRGNDLWMKGGSLTLPLGDLRVPPLEKNNQTKMRVAGVDGEGHGSVTFEIKPVAHHLTCCGMLEQKNERCLKGADPGGSRKRWAVLSDGMLRIYTAQGDTQPRKTIAVKRSPRVEVCEFKNGKPWQKLIGIANPDAKGEMLVFMPHAKDQTKEWCAKLMQAFRPAKRTSIVPMGNSAARRRSSTKLA